MRRILLLAIAAVMTLLLVGSPVLATHLGPTLRINETFDDGSKFVGQLREVRIADADSESPKVVGRLVGEFTSATGEVTQVDQRIRATLEGISNGGEAGTCDILFLDLGPLHLDVLGLVIDLDRVRLNIDAVAGAGNLLGNLLCAVAGLLDPA